MPSPLGLFLSFFSLAKLPRVLVVLTCLRGFIFLDSRLWFSGDRWSFRISFIVMRWSPKWWKVIFKISLKNVPSWGRFHKMFPHLSLSCCIASGLPKAWKAILDSVQNNSLKRGDFNCYVLSGHHDLEYKCGLGQHWEKFQSVDISVNRSSVV